MTIEVSGGGSVAVTTEALLDARRQLIEFSVRADVARERLDGARADAAPGSGAAPLLLLRAANELAEAAASASRLSAELDAAADAYGWAERLALAKQQLASVLLGPWVALGGLAFVAESDALGRHGPAFDDPGLVASLRALADSFDLALVLGVVQRLPGDALEETPVAVTQVVDAAHPAVAPAPTGFDDLARRIPSADEDAPELRVERYELPGGVTHWIVYSAGTADWSPFAGGEPWDLTSDVVGVAGGSAGSTRAALLALRAAGWQPGEPVVPVGHSQGGIVATDIARSGLAAAPLLVTFGSPTAGVVAPRGTVDIAVEHSDDPVPALGGSPVPVVDPRLVVREPAPAAGDGSAKGVHALSGYRRTAAEMDASSDARLIAARSRLTAFTGGGQATVTMWRGERVSGAAPAGSEAGR